MKYLLFLLLSSFQFISCASMANKGLELTETAILGDTGYTIRFPAGWYTRSLPPSELIIVEHEEDLNSKREAPATPKLAGSKGKEIRLYTMATITKHGGGNQADITNADALQRALKGGMLESVGRIQEITFLGRDAILQKTKGQFRWTYLYIAMLDDRYRFFLLVAAPTREEFFALLPTWRRMLKTIVLIE